MRITTTLLLWLVGNIAHAQIIVTAVVTGAYDGDTLYVDADIWPNQIWRGSVRVRGVDSPEIRGQCEQEKQWAIQARDYVRELLTDETVYLAQIENDKYGGRVLAAVDVRNADETGFDNLADLLIENNYGRAYDGGERQAWCGDGLMPPAPPSPKEETRDPDHPLELYDDNDNGRISCAEARAHGIAPVYSNHPAYPYMTDPDGDGVVCE